MLNAVDLTGAGQKCVDAIWIELFAFLFNQVIKCALQWPWRFVRTPGQQCIKHVGNRHNTCSQCYLLSFQPMWVSLAIIVFMV